MKDRYGFLSYSSSDKSFAEKLANKLNENGLDIFFDRWEIKVGDSIVTKIDSALGKMTDLIIILSKKSVSSDWVKKELSSAVMKKLKNNSVRILPVLIEECDIPSIITDLKYADFRQSFESGFLDLIDSLDILPKGIVLVKKQVPLVPFNRYIPILPADLKKHDNTALQFLAYLTDALGLMNGKQMFHCGKCKNPFIFDKDNPKPLVCGYCGEAINWVGILTREDKECPVCKKIFPLTQNYCVYHYPSVKLSIKETDLKLWQSFNTKS